MTDTTKPRNSSDDLVERVAQAMWMADVEPYDPTNRIPFEQAPESAQAYCRAEARAAIALALEEAARVADSYARTYEYKRQMFDDGEITTHTGRALVSPRAIAAAIRALFQKETPNA